MLPKAQNDGEQLVLSTLNDGEQLVLPALAAAATFGKSLAGPETRPGRTLAMHHAGDGAHISLPRCASYAGFSLHANTFVDAFDKQRGQAHGPAPTGASLARVANGRFAGSQAAISAQSGQTRPSTARISPVRARKWAADSLQAVFE